MVAQRRSAANTFLRPIATVRRFPARRAAKLVARHGWQCSFVAEDGRRCDARAFVEFDHETPKALGGTSQPENLRLLCRAHNRLPRNAFTEERTSRRRLRGRG